ncbi:MAG: hypothetical protein D3906_06835, partial [Candidatus Electrothrix sp. AUS1_2]|nr:hypothetical protein [Candidatus Electrothrix sp. AUS1_2]
MWLDRNLGAAQVATSSTDAAAYGDYFQWGRGADGHEKKTSSTTTTLSSGDNPGHGDFITTNAAPNNWRETQNDNLWQGVNGINNPCPAGFRVPTKTELETEVASWSSQNTAGAFASPLKLTAVGYRHWDGSIREVGLKADYWSSTVGGTQAYNLFFGDSTTQVGTNNRAYGFNVRCIKDMPVSTVTSSTGAVWMDRNLGASQVATSVDDAQAYGDLYQWGRGTDGHEKQTSTTTNTQSSGDTPGHNQFIIGSADWRATQNDNLWQGVGGINNPCPAGFRLPTSSELLAEMNSWTSQNAAGGFASPLKLTATGYRRSGDGSIGNPGAVGHYWSSTVSDSKALTLVFDGTMANAANADDRAYGFSVRCMKDMPPQFSTVTSSTGQVWMDRNLGAAQVATSVNDAQGYGDLYQWGRGTDGHEKRTSGTTATLSSGDAPGHGDFITTSADPYDWRSTQNDNLWQGVDGINNPCPAGFRVPTKPELWAEKATWSSQDIAGAFASSLKLLAAGQRGTGGAIGAEGSNGLYWSSTVGQYTWPRALYFDSTQVLEYGYKRGMGYSVRCIKDTVPEPQVSTVTSSTGAVWMDRNLGASQVATSATDEASYGDLYQWGRGTDGHEKRTSATTDVLSTTDNPGHGNFILSSVSYDWRSIENDALWQGDNGVNNPCPGGLRLPFHFSRQ